MSEGAPTPTPDPNPTPPAPPEPRSFSQQELDAIVQERVRRAKTELPADYEDLKSKAAKLDEIEESNRSELEKAQTKAAEAEKKYETALAEAKETRLKSAIISEAAKPDRKVVDPEAVVALLDRSTLDLADDGTPTNIVSAMDKLLEKRPYLVATSGGARAGSADQGARGAAGVSQLTEADLEKMGPEEIVKARKDGRLVELGVAP